MFESGNDTKDSPEFRVALARVRGLFWKQAIWEKSGGKRGGKITFDSLDQRDKDALLFLRSHENRLPPAIHKFVLEIIKEDEG